MSLASPARGPACDSPWGLSLPKSAKPIIGCCGHTSLSKRNGCRFLISLATQRRINGALLDVGTGDAFFGIAPRALRARIARREIPFRRLHAALFSFELEEFVEQLDGCRLKDVKSKMGD